ncbi:hypothetical protein NM688_g5326 [Phlebia brevispora]|uniref:Uncharacterized protein n=1 Tax=Phlebia brevispora TaxID=194682 RepID=A0ACC1SWZ4_9APHY|nr:hypothetical protein NM688_g5326 [Phlebia brevispora]
MWLNGCANVYFWREISYKWKAYIIGEATTAGVSVTHLSQRRRLGQRGKPLGASLWAVQAVSPLLIPAYQRPRPVCSRPLWSADLFSSTTVPDEHENTTMSSSLERYRDNVTGSTSNQDFFDQTGLPPPHALSGPDDPYASTSHLSHQPTDSASRGSYISANMAPGYKDMDTGANYSGNSAWLEKQQASSRKSKFIVIGSLTLIVAAIVVGVVVGVEVSKSHHSSSSSTDLADSSGSSSGNSSSVVNQTNPNDPSTFEPDSRLKHSFYGLAYTPAGSQLPECGNSLDAVIEDIQLISQLTSRIRLYGSDCNQSALVLDAIERTKVNVSVYLGNYNVPTDGGVSYARQRDEMKSALETFGVDNVLGVTVGNEFMLNYLTANGGGDEPNGPIGNAGAELLIPNITDTRQMLASLNLPKTLPVGTADAGSFFNNEVLQQVDYGMSNVHPWFANVSIDQAAAWTASFFQETNVDDALTLPNKPQMFIAETGWPSNSSDVSNETNGPSNASAANLQIFLDTFVCQANANGTGYFYFEFFDETWKDIQFGGVEGWWGLFYANKTLKPITIPDCHID